MNKKIEKKRFSSDCYFLLWFQIMSDENKQPFGLEEDPDLSLNDNEVFQEENQWINELRLALERGCDLGSIRTIGKCRPLTDDLRLSVWKVSRKTILRVRV